VIRARWLAGFSMMILCSGQALAKDVKPACNLSRFSVLPITTLPDGRFTVPGQARGQPINLLVDTGGSVMTLTTGKLLSLGQRMLHGTGALRGVADKRLIHVTFVDLQLGRLQGNHIPFYVDDALPGGADGTLTPDVMKQYDVDIDLAHGAINLFSPQHCPGKVVYWSKGGYIALPMSVVSGAHIQIPVMVDGKRVNALLDTGAISSMVSMRAVKALGISDKSPELKVITEKGERYPLYDYPFKTLDFNGITVTTPRLQVASDGFLPFGTDMLIGANILRRLHLYIAYGEQMLYITPASAN